MSALRESVELRRAEGFPPGVAARLLTLAEIAAEDGRSDEARALLDEARALLDEARKAAESSGATAFLTRVDAALAKLP